MNDPDPKSPWWKHLGTPGIIAFVLAAGLSASMVLSMVTAFFRTNPLGQEASVFLSTLFGTVVGAVATYLGSSSRRNGNGKPPPE